MVDVGKVVETVVDVEKVVEKRVLEEENAPSKAYDIVKEWLKKDPQNERLLLLDDYLSNFLKLQ